MKIAKICPFCNKELFSSRQIQCHLYIGYKSKKSCCDKKNLCLSNDEVRMLFLKANYPNIVSKELLEYHYQKQLKSLPDIQKEFGIDYKATIFLLDYFKISKRSSSQSALLIAQPKLQKTCLKKYGATNPLSKGTIPYTKRNNSVKEKYGVANVFQIEDIKKRITETILEKYGVKRVTNGKKLSETIALRTPEQWKNILEKKIKICQAKWGSDYWMQTEEGKKKCSKIQKKLWQNKTSEEMEIISQTHKKLWQNKTQEEKDAIIKRLANITVSKLEIRVEKILTTWRLGYTHSFCLKFKQFDFKIGKILLEVNGDFYHANPKYYKENDIIPVAGTKNLTAKQLWDKDKRKKLMAEKSNYIVKYIWEDEINSMDDKELEIKLYDIIFGENNEDTANQNNQENRK
jgi:hypothetical protein